MDIGTGAGPRANSVSVRRKRTPRVTSGQVDALLAILEARPFLYTRKFTGLQSRENFETGWKEVAEDLNKLPNGSVKTPEQWMTVWRDLKSRACTKAAKLKKEVVRTGNRGVTTAPLSEVERRVISLVGVDYTLGTDCPDAMPEEDSLQHEMEAGVVISEVLTLPQSQFDEDIMDIIPAEITTSDRAAAIITPPHMQEQVQSATSQSPAPQMISGSRAATVASPPPPQRERPRRNRNLNPRQSVAEQYSAARQEFLAVAEANADTLRMLAAATQMQADATKMQADAAKMQAEAAKVQADASLLFAQAANKIADAVTSFFNKNNQ